MNSLRELQDLLAKAIRFPSHYADRAEALILNNGLPAKERLAIYGRSFYGRLLEIMQQEFPSLRHALGEDLFSQFSFTYLEEYPPTSYTLYELGKNFPKYLSESRPVDIQENWPDFIIELATLERIFSEVFHDQGPETLTTKEELLTIEQIQASPWTRTLNCQFPVHHYFLKIRKGEFPEVIPEPESYQVLVYRKDYNVHLQAISL